MKITDFYIKKEKKYIVAIARYKIGLIHNEDHFQIWNGGENYLTFDEFYYYFETDYNGFTSAIYYWDKFDLKTKPYPKPNFDFMK